MMYLSLALLGIATLFVLLLFVRSVSSFRVCALCAAVSITWVTLLALLYAGVSIDPTLLGILMGGSVVGGMYLLEDKLPERYQVFRLPFFLTFVALSYFAIATTIELGPVLIVLFIWLLAACLFYWRHRPGVSRAVKKIIQCCKNW